MKRKKTAKVINPNKEFQDQTFKTLRLRLEEELKPKLAKKYLDNGKSIEHNMDLDYEFFCKSIPFHIKVWDYLIGIGKATEEEKNWAITYLNNQQKNFFN